MNKETALAVINKWVQERLAGGPVARSTEAWNQVQDALPDLAARIAAGDDKPAEKKPATV